MNRKNFLNSVLSLPLLGFTEFSETDPVLETASIVPRKLVPGDRIGITSPAGYITADELKPAISMLESWGFKVKLGTTIGKRDFSFGGTDSERRQDFQDLMDDSSIKAILCARGGYGAVRIIDTLDFANFVKRPKWIIGFSDITVLHSHLNRNYGVASIHSKMCNSFPEKMEEADLTQVESILSIRTAITGEPMIYKTAYNQYNRTGYAKATLVGGNLKTLETLAGSKSDLYTKNKILFLEDTGEYLYSIDRMFYNLKRTNKLSGLKGLIIGGFKVKPDDPGEEFGRTVHEIVMEKVSGNDYPVTFDFPVGHQRHNVALRCGITHELSVTKQGTTLRSV